MPEALEKWPISLMQSLLPRVYMIIEEIDRRWREYLEAKGQTAFETLHRGAVCLTVAKTANALTDHQMECFGNVTPTPRRGYQVLKSVRGARP